MKRFFFIVCLFFCVYALPAQDTPFPYHVQIDTIVGDCYNNCGVVVTLLDQQGQTIAVNDSLHHPVDSVQYNLFQIQYHYKNQNHNSVFYSDNHIITMDMGTYDIGVSGYIKIQNGSSNTYIFVDTTINGINVLSTYTPFDASILANIAQNNDIINQNGNTIIREYSGNRYAFSCGELGRVQMKLRYGHFPYTVDVILDNDTLQHIVFNDRQHQGTDSLYADYRDYYTFDSLPAGNYRIVAYDACSYTIVFHHTVEQNIIHTNNLYYFQRNENQSDYNIFRFAVDFHRTAMINNYQYEYIDEHYQYRFINPNNNGTYDTTAWHPVPGDMMNSGQNGRIFDTIYWAQRYCDLYGLSIIFQVRDLCAGDTNSFIFTPKNVNTTNFELLSHTSLTALSDINYDTCAIFYDAVIHRTDNYSIRYLPYYSSFSTSNMDNMYFFTMPLYWVYRDSLTHQIIKTDTIDALTNTTVLTYQDVENIYGHYHHIQLPIIRTLYDAQGCVLYSHYDTLVFHNDTTPDRYPSSWHINTNYNGSYYNSCCHSERVINVYEENTPFPQFRDSVIIRLIQSPLYNKYNFTATYLHGEWHIVKDDSMSNDAHITTNEMSLQLRENCLSGGRYVFVCETMCGIDTLTIQIDGIYHYNWEWSEASAYRIYQECNSLFVKPIAGRYTQTTTLINADISNDEPIATSYVNNPLFTIVKGEVNGYYPTSVSLNGTFVFTIPGEYVIKMNFSACGVEYFHYDTIQFVRTRIDFDKIYAVVCDSSAHIGSVFARAINGSLPYTYTLYSAPDLNGSYLGSNQTGIFHNIPMELGQELSVNVTDSCENSYYVNVVAMSVSQSQLLWFEGGQPDPGVCEGDTLHLSALPLGDNISYSWHGPNNFSSNSQNSSFYVSQSCPNGYFVVELLNTGCQFPVKDSIYLNILPPPRVILSAPDTVCAGEVIPLSVTHEGNGYIHYDIYQSYLSEREFQNYVGTEQDSIILNYTILADNLFWAANIRDDYCTYKRSCDSIHIYIRPNSMINDSTHIEAEDQVICYRHNLQLSAQADLTPPYILNWYNNPYQSLLLYQDTLTTEQEWSNYTIPALTQDTTLYVLAYNDSYCPARYGLIAKWENMCNGTSQIQQGTGIRLFDSGGWANNYQNNENLTHSFICNSARWIMLRFNSFQLMIGDSLYIYSGTGTNPSQLIAVYTDTVLPPQLALDGTAVTLQFISNSLNTNRGWSVDILTHVEMKAIHADVIRYKDTVIIQTCQSDQPFSHGVFNSIDVSQEGILHLDTMFYSQMGCDSSIHLSLQVLPKSYNLIDTTICEGAEIRIGHTSYSEEGSYQSIIEAANGCDSVVTLNLQVIEGYAEITASNEDFCEQYMTILSFHGEGIDYQWNTGEQTQNIIVTNPGIYYVTTTIEGCVVTGVYTIAKCDFILYLPNTITPDGGDGLNDYFSIIEQQKLLIQDFEIYIYARWGGLVFYSNDKNFKWYGDYNGYTYHNNMYSYVIFCTDRYGEKHVVKGSVLVK